MKIQNGTITGHKNQSVWKLDSGSKLRVTQYFVEFKKKFRNTPGVTIALNNIDIRNLANSRLVVGLVKAYENGFVCKFQTWGDSRIAMAGIAWTAFNDGRDEQIENGEIDIPVGADMIDLPDGSQALIVRAGDEPSLVFED